MNFESYTSAMREGKVIRLYGEINEAKIMNMVDQLASFHQNPKHDEMVLLLSTLGSNWQDGMIIYNELLPYGKLNKLWIVCQGNVRSMAIEIMMAAPKNRRVAFPLTEFYLHRHHYGYNINIKKSSIEQLQYAGKELEATIQYNLSQEQRLVQLVSEGTNLSEEEVRKYYDNPRHIFPDEAITIGLIDHILS